MNGSTGSLIQPLICVWSKIFTVTTDKFWEPICRLAKKTCTKHCCLELNFVFVLPCTVIGSVMVSPRKIIHYIDLDRSAFTGATLRNHHGAFDCGVLYNFYSRCIASSGHWMLAVTDLHSRLDSCNHHSTACCHLQPRCRDLPISQRPDTSENCQLYPLPSPPADTPGGMHHFPLFTCSILHFVVLLGLSTPALEEHWKEPSNATEESWHCSTSA